MGYIYQHDKRNGKTYVYEKVKKINPKTGMEVDARKIVGRLDPETNTIIPTRFNTNICCSTALLECKGHHDSGVAQSSPSSLRTKLTLQGAIQPLSAAKAVQNSISFTRRSTTECQAFRPTACFGVFPPR